MTLILIANGLLMAGVTAVIVGLLAGAIKTSRRDTLAV